LSGDRDLYAELVKAQQSRLYQLCLSYLGDAHEAEEAAHVVFIKAYRSLSAFRGSSSFGTWLFRIGINQCKDVLKKRSRSRATSLDAILENEGRVPISLIEKSPWDAAEIADIPPEALKRLSRGERDVLLCFADNSGEDYAEIGKRMGLTREAVKGRLKRAREKIQAYLKRHGVK